MRILFLGWASWRGLAINFCFVPCVCVYFVVRSTSAAAEFGGEIHNVWLTRRSFRRRKVAHLRKWHEQAGARRHCAQRRAALRARHARLRMVVQSFSAFLRFAALLTKEAAGVCVYIYIYTHNHKLIR